MLVVLDTNDFYTDVHGTRLRLRGILNAPLSQALYEVFVPEVVLQELDKQFASRSEDLVRDINKTLGGKRNELLALGLKPFELSTVDEASVTRYRATLEKRLAKAGVTILPIPQDLSPAVEWAVRRRQPFKDKGQGLPDAVIWLSILALACERSESITFVTSNVKDFAEPGTDSELAAVLKEDLRGRGRPPGQVRLVAGITAFVDEVAKKTASLETAQNLAADGKLNDAVESAVLFSRLDLRILELDVQLDDDPQVTGLDIEWLEVDDAAELPGGDLLVRVSTEIEVELDLLVEKSDYYALADRINDDIHGVDTNFNERYVLAQTSATLRMSLAITSTPDGTTSETQLESFSLAPVERVLRAIRRRAAAELSDELRRGLSGRPVESYIADEAIESNLDEVWINSVTRVGRVRFVELLEGNGDDEPSTVALETTAEIDVEWAANAPTPFDAEHFAGLALNESSGAPILQDFDSAVPVDVRITARYDDEHGWQDLEFDEVALDRDEREQRSSRMTAADALHYELEEPDEE